MIFNQIEQLITIVCIACVIVMLAMAIDLAAGLYKAKQRGEIRTSWGLKRTISKFIMYEGCMLIAAGVDVLLHLANLAALFHLTPIIGLPVVTCLVGVFLCIIEFVSIREKSDTKELKEQKKAAELLVNLLANKNVGKAIEAALSANSDNPINKEMGEE